MSLGYKLRRAAQILNGLSPRETRRLDWRCQAIHNAELDLLARATTLMDRCITGCQGLCCRNTAIDEIIGLTDLVYVLNRAPHLHGRLAACLVAEAPFFTRDCPFLDNGHGPCFLPRAVRPEVCITTFCADTSPIRSETVRLRRAFRQLGWTLWGLGAKQAMRRFRRIPPERNRPG